MNKSNVPRVFSTIATLSVAACNPPPNHRPALHSPSYDKHVTPNERVTDFRTRVSGVKASHLKGNFRLRQCQEEIAAIIKGKILVGHALHNDLKVCSRE